MINFRRLSVYLLAFVLLVTVSAIISAKGLLIPIDEFVFRTFYSNSEVDEKFENKIILIDLPHKSIDGGLTVAQFRNQLATLLTTIDEMASSDSIKKPTIILDISFSNTTEGLSAIENSIAQLKKDNIKVYGSYPIPPKTELISYADHDGKQAKELYDNYFEGGRKHTTYNYYEDNCLKTYNSFIPIGAIKIESLIVRVANDFYGVDHTNFNDPVTYTVPINDIKKFNDRTYEFTEDSLAIGNGNYPELDKSLELSDSFIIVGVFGVDQKQVCDEFIPGSFLLARSLTDQLQNNELAKEAHSNVAIQLSMVFLFALFICLFFAFIYKYIRKLQTKPLLIAALAFILGLVLLIGFGYALLEYSVIRPALPSLSMFWASFLAWRFTKKFLVTGIMDGGEVYDVFISYSRGDSAFVKKDLYLPLSEFKKPDGSKLNIFFDEKSIGIGELFTTKYMRAIVDSKLFVPVMSEEYYKKNHCKNEMDLAVKRKIEKLISMCIIALDYKYVPDEFTNINFVDITKQSNFMSILKKEIVKEDQKLIDESDSIEQVELDHQESKSSEKKKKVKIDKKDKKTKTKKRSDKKDKKKKAKKRSNKKDKKEQKKKANKRLDKKDKKDKKQKAKKRSDKKKNKDRKKKNKKS